MVTMLCPRCQNNVPPDAKYCPQCARSMQETAAADLGNIVMRAGENLGTMTAVSAESVLGNLIVGDIQQVQIYLLTPETRGAGMRAFSKEDASPYKALKAYKAEDAKIFCGRDEQVDQVVRRIRQQQLL